MSPEHFTITSYELMGLKLSIPYKHQHHRQHEQYYCTFIHMKIGCYVEEIIVFILKGNSSCYSPMSITIHHLIKVNFF